jgi:hypothetical protein
MVTNIIRLAKKNAHCRNLIDSSIRIQKCTGNVENVRIVQIPHGTPLPETKDAGGHAARSYILRQFLDHGIIGHMYRALRSLAVIAAEIQRA